MSVRHFVLTRFNLGLDASTQTGDTWLRGRVDLFERFTLPSMKSQKTPPDRWVLYCSAGAGSPPWFRERIETWEVPWLDVEWIEDRGGEWQWSARPGDVQWGQYLTGRMSADDEHVITSRLDNDDAVARNFCERVRRAYRGKREFINFTIGAQYKDGRVYLRPDVSSPFLSFVEPASPEPQTVYAVSHGTAYTLAPVRQVWSHPMWLGVVHEANFLQSVTGFEVPPRVVLRHFETKAAVAGDGLRLGVRVVTSSTRYGAGIAKRLLMRKPGTPALRPPRADS